MACGLFADVVRPGLASSGEQPTRVARRQRGTSVSTRSRSDVRRSVKWDRLCDCNHRVAAARARPSPLAPGRITNLTRRRPRWSRFREESRDASRRRFPVRDPPPRHWLRDGRYRVESDENGRERPQQLHLQFRLHERQLPVRPLLPVLGFFQQQLHAGHAVRRGQLSDGQLLVVPGHQRLRVRRSVPRRQLPDGLLLAVPALGAQDRACERADQTFLSVRK